MIKRCALGQLQAAGEFGNPELLEDPHLMTQEDKDRGLGSVFKRDDQRLQQRRERDAREKDPNFISESYSECYPGYQEYNREVVDSDEDEDLTKMDMGGRVRTCLLSLAPLWTCDWLHFCLVLQFLRCHCTILL